MDSQLKFDRIVSILFHPLFIPVYSLAIIFSANSPFGYLPFHVKKLIYIIILINNVLLPIALLPFLLHMNFISSFSMKDREERTVPLIITSILYATTSYLIFRFPVPGFLKIFMITVFLVLAVLTVINLRWKISLHAAGMGALVSIVMFLSFHYRTHLIFYLIAAIILAGVVLSSRLRLDIHSPRQVWYGLATGYVSSCLVFLIFQKLS